MFLRQPLLYHKTGAPRFEVLRARRERKSSGCAAAEFPVDFIFQYAIILPCERMNPYAVVPAFAFFRCLRGRCYQAIVAVK
jgi:hypothetical protein